MVQKFSKILADSKKIWIIFLFVIITTLVIGAGIYWWQKLEGQKVQQNIYYENSQLGIGFFYPKNWGVVEEDNSFALTKIKKTLKFPQNEAALFETYGLIEHPNHATAKSLCASYFDYDAHDRANEKKSDQKDIFRLNRVYIYGSCDLGDASLVGFVNIAEKITSPSLGWIPLEEQPDIRSEIKLRRFYFFQLPNPIFPILILKIDGPRLETTEYCTTIFEFFEKGKETNKSYDCMNHVEKKLIEESFKQFEQTQFVKQVTNILDTFKTRLVDEIKIKTDYQNYFKDLAVYTDNQYHFSFKYPKVFRFLDNEDKKAFAFTSLFKEWNEFTYWFGNTYGGYYFEMKVELPEDIKRKAVVGEGYTKEYEELIKEIIKEELEIWNIEKNILSTNRIGVISCPPLPPEEPGYPSFARPEFCEVRKIGNNKAIVKYWRDQYPQPPEIQPIFKKEYLFYRSDYRIRINSIAPPFSKIQNVNEYNIAEANDFTLQILNKIIESLDFK